MNKKFLSVILFSALMVGTAGTFVYGTMMTTSGLAGTTETKASPMT